MTYAEKLLDPRWQRKRLEVLERENFACQLCGDTKTTLHVHHEEYSANPWETDSALLKCYCKHCHSVIEYNKEYDIDTLRGMVKETLDNGNVQLHFAYWDITGTPYIDIYVYTTNNTLVYRNTFSEQVLCMLRDMIYNKAEAP